MKKALVLFLIICGIVLTSNIQAKNLDNIDGIWQNKNSQSLTTTRDTLEPHGLDAKVNPTTPSLIILIIIGFFLAKKHQNLAKKHRNLAKKH